MNIIRFMEAISKLKLNLEERIGEWKQFLRTRSDVLYARFLGRRVPFARLERWQTAYMPAFAVWAWFVAALFPVIFNYR